MLYGKDCKKEEDPNGKLRERMHKKKKVVSVCQSRWSIHKHNWRVCLKELNNAVKMDQDKKLPCK